MQIKAIVDRLSGVPSRHNPVSFAQPWRLCYEAIQNASPGTEWHILLNAINDHPDFRRIMQAIQDADASDPQAASPSFHFPSLAEIAPALRPTRWLWPGWIPRGALSMLGAMPGAGKSLVALDLAHRIIHDLGFPDGSPIKCPGAGAGDPPAVIYIDAELTSHLTYQRARAWGTNTRRLYLFPPQPGIAVDLTHPGCQDTLIEMCYALAPVLIVVDSLSRANPKGENSPQAVGPALDFLLELVQYFDIALLIVHHLRKRSPLALYRPITLDDFRGCTFMMASIRSVLTLSLVRTGPHFDPAAPRQLSVIKTNAAAYPDPLGLELRPLSTPSAGCSTPVPGVALHYGPPPVAYREPTEVEDCAAWLIQFLYENKTPIPPKEIVRLGQLAGYSRRTIYRVRRRLAGLIVDTHKSHNPNNKWVLSEAYRSDPASLHKLCTKA